MALARVADKFGCADVLHLVDTALVWACETQADSCGDPCQAPLGIWLSAGNAPALCQLAQELHLPAFQRHVAFFLGKHADQVNLDKLEACTAALLRGAACLRSKALSAAAGCVD